MGYPSILEPGDGRRLAYHHLPGAQPTVVFLGGLSSNMNGTKALFLEAHCRDRGQAFLRLDYQGHGESSGEFLDGGIGPWSDDALAVIQHACRGPLILIGSSMGAWIMLRVARRVQPHRVVALIGLAAAVDFSEDLLWPGLSATEQSRLLADGFIERTSQYADGPWRIGLALIEDGRRHLQLREPIPLRCPVRLLHGLEDQDIPWRTSLRLLEMIESSDVRLTLIKGGDHRLSSEANLALLGHCLDALLATGVG